MSNEGSAFLIKNEFFMDIEVGDSSSIGAWSLFLSLLWCIWRSFFLRAPPTLVAARDLLLLLLFKVEDLRRARELPLMSVPPLIG